MSEFLFLFIFEQAQFEILIISIPIHMNGLQHANGYQIDFLGASKQVPLPELDPRLRAMLAPVQGASDHILHYPNYSVIQHAVRRLPILTACNIDGASFHQIDRKSVFASGRDEWRKEPRLDGNHQWGSELYRATHSDFDKGHMVKREDVQWGNSTDDALLAAQGTFFYPNAAPQVKDLNRDLWLALEKYILHGNTVDQGLKICLFTGPCLLFDDPVFVTPVRGQRVQLPRLFWKVVFFRNAAGALSKVAFLMGQEQLLEERKIVHPRVARRGDPTERDLIFQQFEQGDTFQVNAGLVEKLTGLEFAAAQEPYADDRPAKLVLQEVEVPRTRGMGALVPARKVIGGLQL